MSYKRIQNVLSSTTKKVNLEVNLQKIQGTRVSEFKQTRPLWIHYMVFRNVKDVVQRMESFSPQIQDYHKGDAEE